MKKLKFLLTFAVVLVMVTAMGITAAYADYEEGEFADNVNVELAYTSAPFYYDFVEPKKIFSDWDGVTEKKNTGKYIYCNVTDKATGEQLFRKQDYKIVIMHKYEEEGVWARTDRVDNLGDYTIYFMYKDDKNEERGHVGIPFTVTPKTVKAADITIWDDDNKLPMKYTGKARKFKPANIDVGKSRFHYNYSKSFWTITKATYKNATKVGTATARYTFQFKNGFKGKVTKTFKYKIVPKDVVLTKCKKTKSTITLRWKKHKTQTTGFRIKVYRLVGEDDEDEEGGEGGTEWKKVKTVYAKSNAATSKKITGLKKNNWYMFEVQAYKTVNGKKYYSEKAVKQMGTKK